MDNSLSVDLPPTQDTQALFPHLLLPVPGTNSQGLSTSSFQLSQAVMVYAVGCGDPSPRYITAPRINSSSGCRADPDPRSNQVPSTPVSCAISDASVAWCSPATVLKSESSVLTWELWDSGRQRPDATEKRVACEHTEMAPGGPV